MARRSSIKAALRQVPGVVATKRLLVGAYRAVHPLRPPVESPELVGWLERSGCEELYLLDNDSVYEPLLAYYERSPHTVLRLGSNVGKYCLWSEPQAFELIRGRPYVYSDPDIVPAEECPIDALDRFGELLERYPGVDKAGFGLRIDDLPEHYPHKQAVLDWEAQMWRWPLGDGAYYAAIDTTFALYRAGSGARPAAGIRTGPPYLARHTDWYVDPQNMSDDERCYRARSERGNWHKAELPPWLTEELERLRTPSSGVRRTLQNLRTRAQIRRAVRTPNPRT